MRLQALWLLRQQRKIKDVAPVIGVHYRTVQRRVAWYRQGRSAEVLWRTPGHGAPGKAAYYLTTTQQKALRARVGQGHFKKVQQMIERVQQRRGVKYT